MHFDWISVSCPIWFKMRTRWVLKWISDAFGGGIVWNVFFIYQPEKKLWKRGKEEKIYTMMRWLGWHWGTDKREMLWNSFDYTSYFYMDGVNCNNMSWWMHWQRCDICFFYIASSTSYSSLRSPAPLPRCPLRCRQNTEFSLQRYARSPLVAKSFPLVPYKASVDLKWNGAVCFWPDWRLILPFTQIYSYRDLFYTGRSLSVYEKTSALAIIAYTCYHYKGSNNCQTCLFCCFQLDMWTAIHRDCTLEAMLKANSDVVFLFTSSASEQKQHIQ